ncbi:MAG: hypothetical protein SF187_19880 [Deltaproteobacteria bacterium]|nr:hypothetical protein [Deltaproteobacteria bacterium]
MPSESSHGSTDTPLSEQSRLVLSRIEEFKSALNAYFKLFLHYHPALIRDSTTGALLDLEKGVWDVRDLLEQGVRLQVMLCTLGQCATKRICRLGFRHLVPVDNPVDWFEWARWIRSAEVGHTPFASIAVRIDSEIERIRQFAEADASSEYDKLPDDLFIVTDTRYEEIFATAPYRRDRLDPNAAAPKATNEQSGAPASREANTRFQPVPSGGADGRIQIVEGSSLDAFVKHSTIWSNLSTALSFLGKIGHSVWR